MIFFFVIFFYIQVNVCNKLSLLALASENNRVAVFVKLIEFGGDVNFSNEKGMYLLNQAIFLGKFEIVSFSKKILCISYVYRICTKLRCTTVFVIKFIVFTYFRLIYYYHIRRLMLKRRIVHQAKRLY